MLKISGFLNIKSASEASLSLRGGNLLNLFFEIYLSYCRRIINEGLVRRYRLDNHNHNALKGRLIFSKQLKHNLIRKDRFYTNCQEYTTDNIYNQILFKALNILSLVSTNSAQKRDANFLVQNNEDISDILCLQDTFARLKYERSTERYRAALRLAELIILNYQPDLKGGSRSVFAILFPMEALFESYVARILLLASRKAPSVEVLTQKSKDFWRTDGKRARKVRPDIILRFKDDENRLVILDTKWKLPGRDNVPADSDLKQMFVYNKLFNADSSNLVYPEVTPTGNRKGVFVGTGNGECSMWFIPIIDPSENRLNKDLGEIMLSQMVGV